MGFGTKGCIYNCGDVCTKECLGKQKKIKLTTIKPQGYPSSLIFGNVTSGVEPLLSKEYYKRKNKYDRNI